MAPPSRPQPRKRDKGELQNTQDQFYNTQLSLWQDRINSSQSAINMAHNHYNNIFLNSTPPSLTKAVFVKVLITLTVAAVPEFGPAILLFRALNNEKENFAKMAGALADTLKDGREQLNATQNQIDDGKKQLAQDNVSVEFFGDLYMKLCRLSNYVTNFKAALTSYMDLTDDSFVTATAKAHKMWMAAGLLTGPGTVKADQLSLLFLYDIMRAYTKLNVSLVSPPGVITPGSSHNSRDSAMALMKQGVDIEFEGLDPAQRKAMYLKFKGITWIDPTRPRILAPPDGNGWKDLLKYWEFKED